MTAIEQRSATLQRGQPTFASLGLLSAVWTVSFSAERLAEVVCCIRVLLQEDLELSWNVEEVERLILEMVGD